MLKKLLKNYIVSVKKETVDNLAKDIKTQTWRPPGTDTTVVHASLYGKHLSVAVSPCVDPRGFSEAIGNHYGSKKATELAVDAIWEYCGHELISRLNTHTGEDEEFIEKYKDVYNFKKVEETVTHKTPTFETPAKTPEPSDTSYS